MTSFHQSQRSVLGIGIHPVMRYDDINEVDSERKKHYGYEINPSPELRVEAYLHVGDLKKRIN